jgi:hypothetical protein
VFLLSSDKLCRIKSTRFLSSLKLFVSFKHFYFVVFFWSWLPTVLVFP